MDKKNETIEKFGHLYESLKDTANNRPTCQLIREIVEECGLDLKGDQRLEKFNAALIDLEKKDAMTPEGFRALIGEGRRLIVRAIRGELAIPDFHSFRETCEDIFESIEKNDPVVKSKTSDSVVKSKISDPVVKPEIRKNIPRLAVLDSEHPDAENADYIPQLHDAEDGWGVSICTVDGQQCSIGATNRRFSIQSCCKPFNYGHALETFNKREGESTGRVGGGETTEEKATRLEARREARKKENFHKIKNLEKKLGVHDFIDSEPSGEPFNSQSFNKFGMPYNPLINAGAIMCCALILNGRPIDLALHEVEEHWKKLSGNQGETPDTKLAVAEGERRTGDGNRVLAYRMKGEEAFPAYILRAHDVDNVLNFYFDCCGLKVTADQMSVAAATLANQGVCPPTGERIYHTSTVTNCLAAMLHCGMYDASGRFGRLVGLPAKSGVGGGILLVVPGVMGICTYSPRLDKIGNSLRGLDFFEQILERYALHMLEEPSVMGDRKMDIRHPILQSKIKAFDEVVSAASQGDYDSLMLVKKHAGSSANFKELINRKDYDGRTALHLAAKGSHKEMVEALLDHGADPQCRDRWGDLAIHDAEDQDIKDILKQAMGIKKDPPPIRPGKWAPAKGAKKTERELNDRFGLEGAPVCASTPDLLEVLWAAANGDLLTIRRHVACGRPLHVADYDHRTPLHLAAAQGHADVLRFLINFFQNQVSRFDDKSKALKTRLSWPDRWSRTPLDELKEPLNFNGNRAVKQKDLEEIQSLLEKLTLNA